MKNSISFQNYILNDYCLFKKSWPNLYNNCIKWVKTTWTYISSLVVRSIDFDYMVVESINLNSNKVKTINAKPALVKSALLGLSWGKFPKLKTQIGGGGEAL